MKKIMIVLSLLLFIKCDNNIERSYYSNGNIEAEITTHDDNSKCFKEFYKSGKLKFEACKEGVRFIGVARFYHENGTLKENINYVNGKIEGKRILYREEGEIEQISLYHLDNNYYSELYENDDTLISIEPIVLLDNVKKEINIQVPFKENFHAAYLDQDLKIFYEISNNDDVVKFTNDIKGKKVLKFNKDKDKVNIQSPSEIGEKRYLNLLVAVDEKNETYHFTSTPLN